MRLVLTGRRQLQLSETDTPGTTPAGYRRLNVLCCAICRTDAKMYDEGHRDLAFPRVMGHEVVAADDNGARYVIWPGSGCGDCPYCLSGRENLCEDMAIMGFHFDGGFSREVVAPEKSIIPLSADVPTLQAAFAEPMGCVVHALNKLELLPGQRLVIFGGGTVGLMAALVSREMGAIPTVIEKSEEKIQHMDAFRKLTGIRCVKETTQSAFDAALNACPDPIAFSLAVTKLAKGGRLSYFSGLKKNMKIETNLLNLIHYREASVHGAYGLTRADMVAGLPLIQKYQNALQLLIENVVGLEETADLMPSVLSGTALKYIVDLRAQSHGQPKQQRHAEESALVSGQTEAPTTGHQLPVGGPIAEVIQKILPVKASLRPAAQKKIDGKTKPLGALGLLEELAVQAAVIQNRLDPVLTRKAMFVFAADHGIAEEGVSAFPAEVTGQMVENFLQGGAAINVLCRHHGIDLRVVDMGVNADLEDHPALIRKKVRRGTRNFAVEEAMTTEEVHQAVAGGMEVYLEEHARQRIDILGVGEMGIANTTSASAIISTITGISPAQATGRGTGIDDKGLEHKAKVMEKALRFHRPDPRDGFDILRKIGGFEIAGIVGAVLAAAAHGTVVVLDGLISTAAGLVAWCIQPDIGGYLISGHRSVEIAQQAALEKMELSPVVDFSMRLGEGTGAAMAIDTVDAACRIMREMASFEEAGVSKKS